MKDNDIFTELSQALDKEEREELLIKLSGSREKFKDSASEQAEVAEFEKKIKIDQEMQKEMRNAGFLKKIWLFLCAIYFRGRQAAFLYIKKRELEKAIERVSPDIIKEQGRIIGPRMAEIVIDLFEEVASLKGFFEDLWLKADILEAVVFYRFRANFKDSLRDCLDNFFTPSQLLDFLSQHKNFLRLEEAVKRAHKDYFINLSISFFGTINREFEAFYYLRKLIFFPFGAMLARFGAIIDEKGLEVDELVDAEATDMLKYLENLREIVYAGSRIKSDSSIHAEVIKTALAVINKSVDAEEDPAIGLETEQLTACLERLIKIVKNLNEEFPWLSILRLIKSDPFFESSLTVSEPGFEKIYDGACQKKLLSELRNQRKNMRTLLIKRESKTIYERDALLTLVNYCPNPKIDSRYPDFDYFPHQQSLNWARAVYDYVNGPFVKTGWQHLEKCIASEVPLLNVYSQLNRQIENIAQNIENFDRSEKTQKNRKKLDEIAVRPDDLNLSEKDTLLEDFDIINNEAKDLVGLGRENIAALSKYLKSILDYQTGGLQTILRVGTVPGSSNLSMRQFIETLSIKIKRSLDTLATISLLE